MHRTSSRACVSARYVLYCVRGSRLIDEEKAGIMPFVVFRQAVAATMDKGVGHAGLMKRSLSDDALCSRNHVGTERN